ncbi:hypothetical protein GGH99_000361, partial [Coemansia sp. RSA 1285]
HLLILTLIVVFKIQFVDQSLQTLHFSALLTVCAQSLITTRCLFWIMAELQSMTRHIIFFRSRMEYSGACVKKLASTRIWVIQQPSVATLS